MNFLYAQDEGEKSISFIPNIVYSTNCAALLNGSSTPLKIDNYNLYSGSIQVNPEVFQSSLSPLAFSDYIKDSKCLQVKSESTLPYSDTIIVSPLVTAQSSITSCDYNQDISKRSSNMSMLLSSSSANQNDFLTIEPNPLNDNEYCFSENVLTQSISANLSSGSHSSDSAFHTHACSQKELRLCSQRNSVAGITKDRSLQTQSVSNGSACSVSHSDSHSNPISEALFVRILVSKCKRIAPLWFRGISSMREKNREENRRTSNNSGHTQNDWSTISEKIKEMNRVMETDTVVNLLKKLHKELPCESVLKFIKCWLGDSEASEDQNACVFSRPDAKGRMRRIDGGKGSDKVWRLDTIVGMLYHGLPMSSTDTNIMVHTCNQELCVRPQHIRFRASSVALVIVLKALAQAGYTLLPPSNKNMSPNQKPPQASDESVDVFGPFTIEEMQQYRSENLSPAGESVNRVSLNGVDRELADHLPILKEAINFHKSGSSTSSPGQSVHTGQHRLAIVPATSLSNNTPEVNTRPVRLDNDFLGFFASSSQSSFVCNQNINFNKRSSLKRPPPGDSPATITTNFNGNQVHNHHSSSSQYSVDSAFESNSKTSSKSEQVMLTRNSSALPEANVFLPRQHTTAHCNASNCCVSLTNLGSHIILNDQDPNQHLSGLFNGQDSIQHMPALFTSQPVGGIHQVQPVYAPQVISSTQYSQDCSTTSGKSTPRQPAKKRLEARTPTIDTELNMDTNIPEMSTPGISSFKVHNDTPFTPIFGRMAARSPSISGLAHSLDTNSASPSSRNMHVPIGAEDCDDEEMETIFSAKRHTSMVQPPSHQNLFVYAKEKNIETTSLHDARNANHAQCAFRSTPGIQLKRCASACPFPQNSVENASLEHHVPTPVPSDRPMTGFASPPSLTPSGYDGYPTNSPWPLQTRSRFSTPLPPVLVGRDGQQLSFNNAKLSQSRVISTESIRGIMNTPCQDTLHDFASRFRDSPLCGTQSDIIEILFNMAQEYATQPNRYRCRPRSQHTQCLLRSFRNSGDSPSPAGFPLNLFFAANVNSTSSATGDCSNVDGIEHMRGLGFTPSFSAESENNFATHPSAACSGSVSTSISSSLGLSVNSLTSSTSSDAGRSNNYHPDQSNTSKRRFNHHAIDDASRSVATPDYFYVTSNFAR